MPPNKSTLLSAVAALAVLATTSTMALSGPIAESVGPNAGAEYHTAFTAPTRTMLDALPLGPSPNVLEFSVSTGAWKSVETGDDGSDSSLLLVNDDYFTIDSAEPFDGQTTRHSLQYGDVGALAPESNIWIWVDTSSLVARQRRSRSDTPYEQFSQRKKSEWSPSSLPMEEIVYDAETMGPPTSSVLRGYGITSDFLLGIARLKWQQ